MASETAAAVASDLAAAADERFDAQAELFNAGLASLLPNTEVAPVIDYILDQAAEADFAKSAKIIPFTGRDKRPKDGGQSVLVDEGQIQAQGQYWDRPGLLTFDAQRAMVDQTPILNAIVQTRIRQVARFCRPQAKASDAGFVIEHVDRNAEIGDEQRRSIQLLERFVSNCGWETDPRQRKRLRRANFGAFMASSVRDSLTLDAAPIETQFKRDRKLGLDGFNAVDGATIRLCTEDGYEGSDEVFALQVIQGNLRTAYTYDDLVYEVRNPRTDVTASGYGYSETEMLIKVVTYLLNTMTYNASFFDKNSIPRGLLNLHGQYDQKDILAFKRYLKAMTTGAQNAHNLPVLIAKDKESAAEFVEIGGQLNEMAFGKWMSFLTSIACAIHCIAPEEVSMESYAASKSSLSGSDTEEKLTSSGDKGLRSILSFYEGVFSDFIIQPFSPDYCLRFKGLDTDDADKRFEMRKLVCTLNEARASEGFDAIKGPIGDAPLNSALLSAWQAQQQAAQGGGAADFGDPDAADVAGEDPPDAADAPDASDDDFGSPEPLGKALGGFGLPDIYSLGA